MRHLIYHQVKKLSIQLPININASRYSNALLQNAINERESIYECSPVRSLEPQPFATNTHPCACIEVYSCKKSAPHPHSTTYNPPPLELNQLYSLADVLQQIFSAMLLQAIAVLLFVGETFEVSNAISDDPSKGGSTGNVVEVEVFGTSRCYPTTKFLQEQLIPTYNVLGHRLRVRYHPYGTPRYINCTETGVRECTCRPWRISCSKNAMQSCILDAVQDTKEQLELVTCTQGSTELNQSVAECAHSVRLSRPLDIERVLDCAHGSTGRRLLAQHGTVQERMVPIIQRVPTIFFNGVLEPIADEEFLRVLCVRYLKPRPPECDEFKDEFFDEI
ncbi:unnamed protein product [Cylicocyclus nassatus]|uniref:Uncharacterized protein n=1 Tax=Cylicocyclus nassatus TaxID=53992 RepID=A0AA36H660_CYLNA|nr:unnamed protein product [Cylicocyclus nassatus]